jgi:hypothetical protein
VCFWHSEADDHTAEPNTRREYAVIEHREISIDVLFGLQLANVIVPFPSASIGSQVALDGMPIVCADNEACRCLLDPAETQEGPDPSSEIEEEETELPISISIPPLDVEEAAFLEDSEQTQRAASSRGGPPF